MLHSRLPLFAQVIESQTVFRPIDYSNQVGLQPLVLCRFKQTLKNRVLNSLPVLAAQLGDTPQSASTVSITAGHIIGNQYVHLLPPQTSRIIVQVATKVPCKKLSLHKRQQSIRNPLP